LIEYLKENEIFEYYPITSCPMYSVFKKYIHKMMFCVYSNCQTNNYSIEHLIPKSFFHNTKDANYWANLLPVDRYINNCRGVLKIGDPEFWLDGLKNILNYSFEKQNIIVEYEDYKLLINDEKKIGAFIINSIFYPIDTKYMGMISRSLIKLFYEFPYLYFKIDEIIDSTTILYKYYLDDKYDIEYQREKKFEMFIFNESQP
jgi:hypothetical protein